MLLFKKKFLELIRSGEKTQTIRLWNCSRMRAGQRSYIPGIGYISILSVEPVEIDRLTDADAIPDGFASAKLLQKELRSIYKNELQKGFRAFRIKFSVFPPQEQERMKQEKDRRKLSDAEQREFVDKTLEKLRKLASEG